MICGICGEKGHNKSNKKFHPISNINVAELKVAELTVEMSSKEYNEIITEVTNIAKTINIKKEDCDEPVDGRIESAIKETPFLNEMKHMLLEKHPDWNVEISPQRQYCDIMINSIKINLKLTNCKSSDNSVNKRSIYYSITGLTDYPSSSNWNYFNKRLNDAKSKNKIKKQRHKPTEYHYLVKNKITGDVLLKTIFDIHNYVSNPSNDLQINWKNEFDNSEYHIEDIEYTDKVKELLDTLQKSVKEMIERTKEFAEADIESLFI